MIRAVLTRVVVLVGLLAGLTEADEEADEDMGEVASVVETPGLLALPTVETDAVVVSLVHPATIARRAVIVSIQRSGR